MYVYRWILKSAFITRTKSSKKEEGAVTNRELQKLSRKELLELLIAKTRECSVLLEERNEARAKLEERNIRIEQAGSIAEAALQLNRVFEAAEAAAGQYLENVRCLSEKQKEACAQREEETRLRCENMEAEARRKADDCWKELSRKLEDFCREHEEIRLLLAAREKL